MVVCSVVASFRAVGPSLYGHAPPSPPCWPPPGWRCHGDEPDEFGEHGRHVAGPRRRKQGERPTVCVPVTRSPSTITISTVFAFSPCRPRLPPVPPPAMTTPTFKKQPASRLPERPPRCYRRRLLQRTRQNWVSVFVVFVVGLGQ